MKNMMSKFAMLAVLTSLSFSAVAGTVTLKDEADNSDGSELQIEAIAKIKGTLEVDLINAGLAAAVVEDAGVETQKFAFGAPATLPADAEDYAVDPTELALKNHTCGFGSSGSASIQRLIEDAARPGNCTLAGAADTISASWKVGYVVRASGGATGSLTLDVENDVATDGFLTAAISATSDLPMGTIQVNDGNPGSLLDASAGDIEYEVSFDIRGVNSKKESRALFTHVLQLMN